MIVKMITRVIIIYIQVYILQEATHHFPIDDWSWLPSLLEYLWLFEYTAATVLASSDAYFSAILEVARHQTDSATVYILSTIIRVMIIIRMDNENGQHNVVLSERERERERESDQMS